MVSDMSPFLTPILYDAMKAGDEFNAVAGDNVAVEVSRGLSCAVAAVWGFGGRSEVSPRWHNGTGLVFEESLEASFCHLLLFSLLLKGHTSSEQPLTSPPTRLFPTIHP